MTRRGLGALGAVVVLAMALVGLAARPALAAGPGLAWASPAEGATLTGPVTLSGQVQMGNGGCTDRVSVALSTSQPDHPVPGPFEQNSGAEGPMNFNFHPAIPKNGIYTATATAFGRAWPCQLSGTEQSVASRTFKLEIPPATPSGAKAVADNTKRTVTISWNANPEPDVIGYTVLRKAGSGYVALKSVTGTSYTHELGSLPKGDYEYQVYAARPNADGSNFVPSTTPATTNKATITSSPPSSATSTTTPAGGSGAGRTGGTTNTTSGSGAGSSKSPTVATHGKADLSGFTALLPNGGGRLPAARQTPAPDSGFEEALPFKSDGAGATAAPDDSVETLGGQPLGSSKDDDAPTSLLFLAAGLFVTVVLMHVLWLRDEVNRDALAAVPPQDPAEPTPA